MTLLIRISMSHSLSCRVEVGGCNPHRVDSGGADVGRSGLGVGVVGRGVKTALVLRGDHGGGDKKLRRCQRGKISRLRVANRGVVERDVDWTKTKSELEEF